jgi:hypothetical protein
MRTDLSIYNYVDGNSDADYNTGHLFQPHRRAQLNSKQVKYRLYIPHLL